MSYLIIMDNGKSYSDHSHAPLMSAETKELGENALTAFREWHKRWPKDVDGDYAELTYEYNGVNGPAWLAANPPPAPIPEEMMYAFGQDDVTFALLEVPDWSTP